MQSPRDPELDALRKILDANQAMKVATLTVLWEEHICYDFYGVFHGKLESWGGPIMPTGMGSTCRLILTMHKSPSDSSGEDNAFEECVLTGGYSVGGAIYTAKDRFGVFVKKYNKEREDD